MPDLPQPDPSIHPVGRNTSRVPGQMQLALLRHCGLEPGSDLLEIGCGIGRLVYELADQQTGRYVGFDIASKAIEWLNDNYAPRLTGYEFHLVDAVNRRYRPKATMSASDVRFPVDDAAVDVVCAFSVFTHMQFGEVERYLAETARVLRPGGRGVLTFFAVGADEDEPRLDHHGQFVRIGDHAWTTSPEIPERAIAFDEARVRAAVTDAGLVLHELRPGYWRDKAIRGRTDPPFHKDVFVVGPA